MDITISENLIVTNSTEKERTQLKQLVSFINPAWEDAIKFGRSVWGIPRIIRQYEESDNALILPRGCLYSVINTVGIPKHLIDKTAKFQTSILESQIKLRPLQKVWVENMLLHKQGIGVAPAGSGKTVMALHIIATLGQPTLWLTHRKTLLDQFKERANFFISAGHIGTIGSGKYDLGDLITVGMIQTLSRSDIEELTYNFGVVFLDEAHVVPSRQAMLSIKKFAPSYLYGLTATPYREDRLEKIIFDTIGPIISTMDRDAVVLENSIMPATIKVCNTGITYPYIQYSYIDVINYLATNEKRNKLIIQDIISEVALGNICIALTSRIEHGAILKTLLEKYGVECEHIHSELTNKQREESMGKFLSGKVTTVVATYQLLSEGFDHQPSSRIFFTLPHKARGLIEQSKGRIERIFKNKKEAIVYDYVDPIVMLEKQFEKRLVQYHEHGLKIIRKN